MKKWLWILIVLAAAGAAAWWGVRQKKADVPVIGYDAVPVTRGDIAVTIESTGVVRPQNRIEIKPPVAGRIEDVLVREGARVKSGQVVASMSSSDRAALLDAARARGPEELARWQEIYKATPLIAPLDGEIIARSMEPGQTATASDTVLVLSDKLIIEAQVDETDLAQIRLGQETVVALDAYAQERFPARVSHIAFEAETVDNVTIYKVQVLPDQMPQFVRSGMTANVTFTATSAEGKLVVPAEAVRDEGGRQMVSVPSPGGGPAIPREVKTGLTDGKRIEIQDGLAEGELVQVPKVRASTAAAEQKSNPFMPFRPRGARSSSGSGRRTP